MFLLIIFTKIGDDFTMKTQTLPSVAALIKAINYFIVEDTFYKLEIKHLP